MPRYLNTVTYTTWNEVLAANAERHAQIARRYPLTRIGAERILRRERDTDDFHPIVIRVEPMVDAR